MNWLPADTTPDAAEQLHRLLLVRSSEARIRMACDMFESARALVIASFPREVAQDPVRRAIAVLTRMYGHDVDGTFLTKVIDDLRRRLGGSDHRQVL